MSENHGEMTTREHFMDEIKRLRALVEELEKKLYRHVVDWERIENDVYITNEMINAAVTFADEGADTHEFFEAWEVLNIFGIHRCDGCGGKGRIDYYTGISCTTPCPDCAPWGSKGWVIK